MVTFQEYLDNKYKTREEKKGLVEISTTEFYQEVKDKEIKEKLDGGELDLSEYINCHKIYIDNFSLKSPFTKLILGEKLELKSVVCSKNLFTFLDLSKCPNLEVLRCEMNQFTTVEFLNQLPNPEKLEKLVIHSNNIQSTDISFFSKFVNLRALMIGTMRTFLKEGKRNLFYGSLESWNHLTKLEKICIEATDVDKGLEYLPLSLAQSTKKCLEESEIKSGYTNIQCSPEGTNAKCKVIQDALEIYDYDLEAWQLVHPHKMYQARPELFEQPNSREKWLNAVIIKMEKTETKLQETKQNEPDKVKRIKRLQSKIRELELIKKLVEERGIFEDSLERGVKWYNKFKEDKATQTKISGDKIKQLLELEKRAEQTQLTK